MVNGFAECTISNYHEPSIKDGFNFLLAGDPGKLTKLKCLSPGLLL